MKKSSGFRRVARFIGFNPNKSRTTIRKMSTLAYILFPTFVLVGVIYLIMGEPVGLLSLAMAVATPVIDGAVQKRRKIRKAELRDEIEWQRMLQSDEEIWF